MVTYFRGITTKEGAERRLSTYLTRSEREAKFYGENIERVTVNPKNPLYSETAVDAAEKLGVLKEYDALAGTNAVEADNVIYRAAKKQGYDAIIRRAGDWIQVIDQSIITKLPTPEIEPKTKETPLEKWEREAKTKNHRFER